MCPLNKKHNFFSTFFGFDRGFKHSCNELDYLPYNPAGTQRWIVCTMSFWRHVPAWKEAKYNVSYSIPFHCILLLWLITGIGPLYHCFYGDNPFWLSFCSPEGQRDLPLKGRIWSRRGKIFPLWVDPQSMGIPSCFATILSQADNFRIILFFPSKIKGSIIKGKNLLQKELILFIKDRFLLSKNGSGECFRVRTVWRIWIYTETGIQNVFRLCQSDV